MNSLERFTLGVIAALVALAAAWFWHVHAVSAARDAGYKDGYHVAVEKGRIQHEADAAQALRDERSNRERFARLDDAARQERESHAQALSDAQSRLRAGDERLRIAIHTIRTISPAADRPVAGGPAADDERADIVPEVAAAIVGIAADSAEVVRKYDRLYERFEACRSINNDASSGSVAP